MTVHVRRASGLLVPFEPPDVTVEAAIERRWHLPEGGMLLTTEEPEYLPTRPTYGWPVPMGYSSTVELARVMLAGLPL